MSADANVHREFTKRVFASAIPIAFSLSLLCAGCTTVEQTRLSSSKLNPTLAPVFATQEDITASYVSKGPIQATRRGVLLFGFLDPAGTDMQAVLDYDLFPAVRKLGGDGVINLRYERTQYTLAQRILFFLVPLPTEVTVTGEVVSIVPSSDWPSDRNRAPKRDGEAPQ